MDPRSLQITTPTDTTIVLTRTFNAPRRLLWAAMFEADKLRRWMLPPPGWTRTVCVVEAHVGGALSMEFKNEESDQVMTIKGVFTEVAPHDRIVHTETMEMGGVVLGSLVETHELTEKGAFTTMRITQVYKSKEERDGAIASGMDQGMEACYQQLDALIAQAA